MISSLGCESPLGGAGVYPLLCQQVLRSPPPQEDTCIPWGAPYAQHSLCCCCVSLSMLSWLLQGADGTYGTSLPFGTAMDPGCDVMVAYKQNDRFLQPDHGFPIRMIIPGHIGEDPQHSL